MKQRYYQRIKSWREWSISELRDFGLHKETLTKEQRRDRYNALRALGASRDTALRFRDWPEKSFQMAIESQAILGYVMIPFRKDTFLVIKEK
jgi:hypothetical protein